MPKSIKKLKQYPALLSSLQELLKLGIVYNAGSGYTESDAIADLAEIYQGMNSEEKKRIWGYCLYHEQDSARVLKGQSLMLSFGAINDSKEYVIQTGNTIIQVLNKNGFITNWNGTESERIEILNFN